MREVDRAMIEDYGVQLIQMMENAGRSLAQLARDRFLGGDPRGRRVVVLAGKGGNGGGGLVCARHLSNWGTHVRVFAAESRAAFEGVSGHQMSILEKMGANISYGTISGELPNADLIVDAVIGYSLQGSPRGTAALLVAAANAHPAPVLSLDVPSGIDATTGAIGEPAIRATATLTLALPKSGLFAKDVPPYVGDLYLGDISVPPQLYGGLGLEPEVGPIFATDPVIRLR